jgi:benzil reductase ((S)-benzoin forming)
MRSVVLTGVSRGLGAELFAQFVASGDRVLGIGQQFTPEQRLLSVTEPDRVRLLTADLSDPAEIPTAKVLADFLRVGDAVLVNNAGVVDPIGPIGSLDPAATVDAVNVNLVAPMLLTNAFLEARRGPVRILFISSGAAHRAVPGWGTYCATKAGAEMFFEVLESEVADDPTVGVARVDPGVMDTDMQAAVRAADFPERERYAELHRRGQLPDPAAVARRIIAGNLS